MAVQLSPESVATCVEQTGLGFMFAPYFHPAMKAVRQVRSALQVRTLPLPFWIMLTKTLQLLSSALHHHPLIPALTTFLHVHLAMCAGRAATMQPEQRVPLSGWAACRRLLCAGTSAYTPLPS